MFEKHKTLSIIIAFLLLASIGGYVFLSQTQQGENILSIFHPKEKRMTYAEIEQQSLENSKQQSEIFNQAQQKQDSSLCDTIEDTSLASECRDRIIIAKIWNSGDLTLCDNIKDEKRQTDCRDLVALNIARDQGVKWLCARISNENGIKRCREDIDGKKLATILQDKSASPSVCSTLEENFQKECLRSIDTYKSETQYLEATKTKNLAACDAISEPQLQTDCRDNILLEKAVTDADIWLCWSISNAEKQSYCVKKWNTQKDISAFKEATNSWSLALCWSIVDGSLKNRCHDIVTLALVREKKDASLCDTLTDKSIIENCKRIQP